MAAIAFFILLTLTLSSTIHARESQFFNKFSNNIPKESQPLNTIQQQPDFVPQSQDSSYGLYGHESGQLPPSTTTTNLPANLPENYNPVAYTTPIHSSTQDIPDEFKDPQAYQYNGENKMYNSQEQEEFMGTNGGNMYNSEKQGMSDTRFLENGRYYYAGNNGYKSQKQGFEDARFMETENGGNMYNSEKHVENGRYNQGEEMYNSQRQGMGTRYGTSNNANTYNTEKQGMSDTRFLENGKYFYDLNMENFDSNANRNTRGFNSRNEYNTQGYYGNNGNSYDRYNSNFNGGGYQNQEYQFNP
ncbi:hypothetical protein L1987_59371 [Smallanthus sonchifolius]|uniref:Uncharacterized protein n=1 Tax=Smallanthus sonchifolius TaxID=185202 RepID=A0ACB9D525_9ASTR|nr:hypothetical protein L1987_59371 [Smallanthus sonchifolius]